VTQDPSQPPTPPEPAVPPTREATTFGLGGESPAQLVRLAAAFYGVVTVFAFGYAIFDRIQRGAGGAEDDPFLGLGLPSIGGALSGVGVGLVIVGVVHVGMRILPAVAQAARLFAGVFGPLTWIQGVLLALFSSVAEELLFRGALWPHLGWIGTSFLFGLVHILPSKRLWGYPLFALLAGVLFAILREATGSVLPAILAHFTVNAINLVWLGRQHTRLTDTPGSAVGPSHA
jgi:membrane protease YdiL (CAAX protease family)